MLPSNNFRTVAVLIGYQYQKPTSNNILGNGSVLPGILIDLYQAYKFAERSSPTEIIVITDIEEDQIWHETVSAMGKNIVDSGILDFIATIRKKGSIQECRSSTILLYWTRKKWLYRNPCSKNSS